MSDGSDRETGKLALYGGRPTFPEGPPPWPLADDEVLAALEAAYRDRSWGRYHGPHGGRLAEVLAEMHGLPCVLLCCSGTFAVELALRALKIGSGDEVILAAYDFPGNFRGIEAVGARPVLADVDPYTLCLQPDRIDEAIGPDTRAVLVSHLHGCLAPMQAICQLAERRGLAVIEDACQATGAQVQGRAAGAWGDVGVLSFGGSKLLTAGRGGALLTRDPALHQRAKIYVERGNDAYPLSELQAAVLPPQLRKLAERNQRRRRAVDQLLKLLPSLPGWRPLHLNPPDSRPSYYKLAWRCGGDGQPALARQRLLAALQAEGIGIDAGFRGFTHRSPRRCRRVGSLQHSAWASEQIVVLHHPVLLEPQSVIDRLASGIRRVLLHLDEGGGDEAAADQ